MALGYELWLPETRLEGLEELMKRPIECLLFGIDYSQVVIDYIKELENGLLMDGSIWNLSVCGNL